MTLALNTSDCSVGIQFSTFSLIPGKYPKTQPAVNQDKINDIKLTGTILYEKILFINFPSINTFIVFASLRQVRR